MKAKTICANQHRKFDRITASENLPGYALRKPLAFGLAGLSVLLTLAMPLQALANAGDVIRDGTCSGPSDWKLKASPENSKIEVEFEVDQNQTGQAWDVVITQNKTQIFKGRRTTQSPSGSFTVRRVVPDKSGNDVFRATATNVRSGEVCRGRLTF